MVIGLDAFSNMSEENVSFDIQNHIRQEVANKMTQTDYRTYHQHLQGIMCRG